MVNRRHNIRKSDPPPPVSYNEAYAFIGEECHGLCGRRITRRDIMIRQDMLCRFCPPKFAEAANPETSQADTP